MYCSELPDKIIIKVPVAEMIIKEYKKYINKSLKNKLYTYNTDCQAHHVIMVNLIF